MYRTASQRRPSVLSSRTTDCSAVTCAGWHLQHLPQLTFRLAKPQVGRAADRPAAVAAAQLRSLRGACFASAGCDIGVSLVSTSGRVSRVGLAASQQADQRPEKQPEQRPENGRAPANHTIVCEKAIRNSRRRTHQVTHAWSWIPAKGDAAELCAAAEWPAQFDPRPYRYPVEW